MTGPERTRYLASSYLPISTDIFSEEQYIKLHGTLKHSSMNANIYTITSIRRLLVHPEPDRFAEEMVNRVLRK
jgi:hypothetical protein